MRLAELFEDVAPNQKPEEDIGNAADDSLQSKLGTYAAVAPNQKTKTAIANFMQDIKLVNPVDPDSLHATVLYSPKFLPDFHARGSLDQPYIGTNLSTDIWDTNSGTRCLVLMFSSQGLEQYHNDMMQQHEAEYPYDSYIPHMTLSYDLDDTQYDTDTLSYELARYLDHLEFDQEYEEPLQVDSKDADDNESDSEQQPSTVTKG